MRIVESNKPRPVRSVERKRVGETMRSPRSCLDARDFKLEPVALFQMMNAPVERQQELEAMVRRRATIHIIL